MLTPMASLGYGLLLSALVASPGLAWGADLAGCVTSDNARIWWSPRDPSVDQPLRILAVVDDAAAAELRIAAPGEGPRKAGATRRPGPPISYAFTIDRPRAGPFDVELVASGKRLACARIAVRARASQPTVRPPRLVWDRTTEGLYAAWIEQLFDAPVDKSLDFRPLHQALRDPGRNFLANHLGLREDDPRNRAAIVATPDCADLPYFLRAYFAWKLGLPFGFRDCDRGSETRPPRCGALGTNEQGEPGADPLTAARRFFRSVMNKVQSGSARTALLDEQTDYYPIKLDRRSMRPGTVYADPYGHVLMIVKWVTQTADHGGLLLAVDGQPDTSIGRKRFWEGTFLFTNETPSAGPGFKAFRPIVAGGGPTAVALTNAAITPDKGFSEFSAEQAVLSPDAFYARLATLINPAGLEAAQAYGETLDALVEQLQTRVGSVDNGETYMRQAANPVVPMPEGSKIFETTGPWEDYATPSRDMRLLIAMNVLLGLPERIVRHPELYRLNGRSPESARADIARLHAGRIVERGIEYRRSDGSSWKLTVADLLARRAALEVAYNPNDCVEARWGAAEGTPEYATCARHAPADQHKRMADYRSWFRDARRPPR